MKDMLSISKFSELILVEMFLRSLIPASWLLIQAKVAA